MRYNQCKQVASFSRWTMKTIAKRNIFLAVAGLIVAHFRYLIQYDRLPYQTMWEFIGAWFIHYIWVALVVSVAYAFCLPVGRWVFGSDAESKKLSVDDALVFFTVVILVAVLSVFFISFYPSGSIE